MKRLLLHILQQHHLLILFLPHLKVVMIIIVTSNRNHHLVQMEEDNEAVLGVELDKAHLIAEVLDHHPGLALLRLTRQRVGPELWHPCLEEEMPAQESFHEQRRSIGTWQVQYLLRCMPRSWRREGRW